MSYVIVFRSRLRAGVEEPYGQLGARIAALAVAAPGFVSAKDFVAEDGERVSIVEFDSEAHLLAWRDHAEHRAAQEQGRAALYERYSLQVCRVERASTFDAATGRWEQRPARD